MIWKLSPRVWFGNNDSILEAGADIGCAFDVSGSRLKRKIGYLAQAPKNLPYFRIPLFDGREITDSELALIHLLAVAAHERLGEKGLTIDDVLPDWDDRWDAIAHCDLRRDFAADAKDAEREQRCLEDLERHPDGPCPPEQGIQELRPELASKLKDDSSWRDRPPLL